MSLLSLAYFSGGLGSQRSGAKVKGEAKLRVDVKAGYWVMVTTVC